ncbi:HD-GYP domain-containing protein [Paenibacillus sp. JCM 10914]|uniref:HD-GYP domain-containing protein n=1 Tax=Paenibacillus sp. JCM 10914 TaxID=1236974 RepID=UPI00056932F2|nr:HD-GYP domain-containing protein [Paenibacillus sp. JCM 10914]
MRVHVTDLIPGDQMQQDAYNQSGLHVLKKGTSIRSEDISKLKQHGIDYIEIVQREVAITTDPQSDLSDAYHNLLPHFQLAFDGCSTLFSEAAETGRFNSSVVDDSFQPLINSLNEHSDVVSLLLLFNGKDDYTYRHSIQVGMLCYYIANWMGYASDEAYHIGTAGYLHDIGKCKIPSDILNKPGKLLPEEFEAVKLHTIYGYEIISESMDDKISATVALQHHERDDGSGYPRALREEQIHPYAHICAVADVYSAMTTNRVYQSKQQLLTVLRELYGLSFGKLNGKPTHAFIQQMLPNFIGKKVELTNGESGIIVMNHPSDYFRPLVQVGPRFVDLSKEVDVAIAEILL